MHGQQRVCVRLKGNLPKISDGIVARLKGQVTSVFYSIVLQGLTLTPIMLIHG